MSIVDDFKAIKRAVERLSKHILNPEGRPILPTSSEPVVAKWEERQNGYDQDERSACG